MCPRICANILVSQLVHWLVRNRDFAQVYVLHICLLNITLTAACRFFPWYQQPRCVFDCSGGTVASPSLS